jgi:hypothetical protein
MVTSLTLISYRDGVCVNRVLGKHHLDSFYKCASFHVSNPLHPDVIHFHVFGSVAWDGIHDEKRKAL